MENRSHFSTLDGLRGVAAISVVLLHLRIMMFGNDGLFCHAYLAVDFFFMLSGFVVACAYERRLKDGLSFGAFARIRAIRLYPLIALGTLIGASYQMARAASLHDRAEAINVGIMTGFSLLSLPTPSAVSDRPFLLDVPLWSLFFELIANAAYAVVVPKMTTRAVVIATVAAGALDLAMVLQMAPDVIPHIGSGRRTLVLGAIRTAFPFLLGVVLFRLRGRIAPIKINGAILAGVLTAILVPVSARSFEWLYFATCVGIVFPFVIVAASSLEPNGALSRVMALSGAISYPLYVLHWPVALWIISAAKRLAVPDVETYAICFFVALIFAVAALRIYDEPTRRFLSTLGRKAAVTI